MRNRIDLTVVLAVIFPLVVGLVLALTRPEPATIVATPPTAVPLTAAELTCPGRLASSTDGAVLAVGSFTGDGGTGEATVTTETDTGTGTSTIALTDAAVSRESAPSVASVISSSGETAPGLAAITSTTTPLSVAVCSAPLDSLWFTGVGAGPTQDSVLELTNPNSGAAVADIEVLGDLGTLDVPELRGVAVAGGGTVQLDLGQIVPSTATLGLHVAVVRGQLGVAVRDRGERLTGGTATEDWLAPQTAPSTDNLLLGLQPGSGRHTLALANPSDSEVTATVRLLTDQASFAPDGVEPIVIAPHSVARTILDDLITGAGAEGAVGLEITSSAPVTASLRSVVDGDLSFLVPGPTLTADTTTVVPATDGRLTLAGATAVGVATVTSRTASGTVLETTRVELGPDRAATVELPARTASVQVVPERTTVQGAVLLTGDGGAAVVPLRDLQRTGAVPSVVFGP